MHAGRQTKMKRGAIWACVIPVGLGMVLLISIAADLMLTPTTNGNYWGSLPKLGPIAASFVFVPPLSAWAACRSLAKIDSTGKISRWRSSAVRALLSATLIHFVWGALYTFSINITSINLGVLEIVPNIVGWLLTNILLWLISTLPLSLLCATIFWKVTKFPNNTNVF